MLKKIVNCVFCGNELIDHNAKRRFCSDRCRVYYGRELKKGNIEKRVDEETTPIKVHNELKELNQLRSQVKVKEKQLPTNLSKIEKLQWLRENK